MTNDIMTMGKKITCHHGTFNLPTEIYEIEIDDDRVRFFCEDGVYEAKQDDKWKITQIVDHYR